MGEGDGVNKRHECPRAQGRERERDRKNKIGGFLWEKREGYQ